MPFIIKNYQTTNYIKSKMAEWMAQLIDIHRLKHIGRWTNNDLWHFMMKIDISPFLKLSRSGCKFNFGVFFVINSSVDCQYIEVMTKNIVFRSNINTWALSSLVSIIKHWRMVQHVLESIYYLSKRKQNERRGSQRQNCLCQETNIFDWFHCPLSFII